jgi:hypothetical protein
MIGEAPTGQKNQLSGRFCKRIKVKCLVKTPAGHSRRCLKDGKVVRNLFLVVKHQRGFVVLDGQSRAVNLGGHGLFSAAAVER